MATCNDFRDQLLDLLYGLVEGQEEQELQAHLAGCHGCQADLEQAKRQQQLLARAAHFYREVPLFVPPQESPASPAHLEPAVIKIPAAGPRRRHWARWAAAAAILLAVGGIYLYQERLHQYRADFARAKEDVKAIDSQVAQLQQSFPKKEADVTAQAPARVMHIQVMGPTRHEADAPVPLRVLTHDSTGRPAQAQLIAKYGGREITASSTGDATLSLPPGATSGKGQLVVEAHRGQAVARVVQNMQVDDATLVTHVATNKSVYQVGETVLFRTLTLQRFSLRPPAKDVKLKVSLRDATGREHRSDNVNVGPGGIGGGELTLLRNLLGGEYTLRFTGGADVLPQERRLTIVRDLPPQITLDRKHYQPGDSVSVRFRAGRPLGGNVAPSQLLRVQAELDGKALSVNGSDASRPVEVRTDEQGEANFQVKLPAKIEKGPARVDIQIDGGAKLSQPIPLADAKLTVEFFPEGGDLIAGLPNRVYYRVRNSRGEPVDPRGRMEIFAGDNKVVLDVDQKKALGSFTFVPDARQKYRLRLTAASGVTEVADAFKDVVIRPRGIAFSVAEAVSPESRGLRVALHASEDDQRLLIVATCRGHTAAQRYVTAGKSPREEVLELARGTRGVVRLTLYRAGGDRLTPLAERLIYRVPGERLSLAIGNLKQSYRPAEAVTWTIQAANEQGVGETAWLLAAVVDEKVLGPADARAATPPVHFYVTNDVQHPEDLEKTDVLFLDSEDARRSLDLFLGTQGWRRFTTASEAPAFAADAKTPSIFSCENDTQANLLAQADALLKKSLSDLRAETVRERRGLEDERNRLTEVARVAALGLADFQNLPAVYLSTGAGILMVALLFAGAGFLAFGLARLARRALAPTRAFAGAFGALAACLVLFAARGTLPTPDPKAPGTYVAEIPAKTWPALPEGNVPQLAKANESSVPVGSCALSPAASTPPTAVAGSQPLTPDMRARLSDRGKLAVPSAPPSQEIKPMLVKVKNPPQSGKTTHVLTTQVEMPRSLRVYSFLPTISPTLADTMLWHPAVFVDDGIANVSFGLAGNITTYRILLYGHSPSGRLGVFEGTLQVRP
jgi:hypothetical protein